MLVPTKEIGQYHQVSYRAKILNINPVIRQGKGAPENLYYKEDADRIRSFVNRDFQGLSNYNILKYCLMNEEKDKEVLAIETNSYLAKVLNLIAEYKVSGCVVVASRSNK